MKKHLCFALRKNKTAKLCGFTKFRGYAKSQK